MRAAEPVSLASMLASYRMVARNPAYLAYLGLASTSYAGLFAWISGASFVLQNLYGLDAVHLRHCLCARFGRLHDRLDAGRAARAAARARRHHRRRRLRVHRRRARHGGGGGARPDLGRLAGSADGGLSRRSRHGAAAVDRRRHDAVSGTRRRRFRRCSASCSRASRRSAARWSAGCSGTSAWPLALAVAAMGCATLVLWLATRAFARRPRNT